MSIDEKVRALSQSAINDIELHYDSATSSGHGSGDHWILMAVLDKYGFRILSPTAAVDLAEEIITRWYHLQT